MGNRINILGTYVDALTMDETINRVKTIIKNKEYVQHVVVNASKVNLLNKDEKLKKIINNCKLINADGQSIVWASKYLKKPLPERVTGIDLFINLIGLATKEGYKVYFFGAKEEVLKTMVENFKNKYPNLIIAGYRNGYFNDNESVNIAKDISSSKPDILFVGFSSPKKEYWINDNMSILNIPFIMGVGGSFDVIAGITKRAPKWMQKFGMEWFYRFIQEPTRMWRRYIIGNINFIGLVIKEKVLDWSLK